MSTTTNRKKSVIAALGALALVLGAILFALSAPVVRAAPDDGTGSNDPSNVPPGPTGALAPPPQIQASENPVVFLPDQTVKYIMLTWKPYQQAAVQMFVTEDGAQFFQGYVAYPNNPTPGGPVSVTYGKTYKAHLETLPENGLPKLVGPTLTITTKLAAPAAVPQPVPLPIPQPPEINPTLIPRLPNLAPSGTQTTGR